MLHLRGLTAWLRQRRGHTIYQRGESGSGQVITARIADGPELPATTLACVQCHGISGRGRTEGGVTASDIRWEKPYVADRSQRGKRAPRAAYTEPLLARAITMGWDSSGQTLLTAMPRYQMAPADLGALIAYLKSMGSVPVPGVSETAIRIGIVLPDDANSRVKRDEVLGTVSEAIRRLNDSGGVFRRTLELTIVEDTRGIGEKVFAVLGGFTPNPDRRLADVESARVPTVGVYAEPATRAPSNRRESFSLMAGPDDQVRSLVRFATVKRLGFDAGIAVLAGRGQSESALAEEAAGDLRARGARSVVVVRLPGGGEPGLRTWHQLRERGIQTFLFTDASTELHHADGRQAAKPDQDRATTASAGPLDEELETARRCSQGDLYRSPFSFRSRSGAIGLRILRAAFRALCSSRPRCRRGLARGLRRCAAVTLLTEGLKKAGRDLDRESFASAMERIALATSGDAVPISFWARPARRDRGRVHRSA